MTRKDIDDIISILCPNDEDYEKTYNFSKVFKAGIRAVGFRAGK